MVAIIGLAKLPIDPSLFNDSIREATDPAQGLLLNVFSAALNYDLQAGFDKIKLSVPVLDGYVVNYVLPFDPENWITRGIPLNFPILSVWRKQQVTSEFSIDLLQVVTTWGVRYVLPNFELEDMARAHALLQGVANSLRAVLYNGYHPAYGDGYQALYNGVFYDITQGTLEFANWLAQTKADTEVNIPMLDFTFQTTELMNPDDSDGSPDLLYKTISIDLGISPDEIDDFVVGDTRYPPDEELI